MAERILVAVDGRAAGDRAVEWTAARAARTHAHVTVFQAVEVPAVLRSTEHRTAMHRVADSIAANALATLGAAAPGIVVEARTEEGDPVDLLEQVSADVDLIVVGTNGSRGPFQPSTRAVRIAASAASPVVVVPDAPLDGREGVVVGVDGSESSAHALAFAAAEADARGERLIALTTWRQPVYLGYEGAWPVDLASDLAQYAEEQAAIELAGLASQYPDLVVERRILEASGAEALVAASEDASLVVVGSRGLGPVRRLLLGSVSHALVQHARGPIAVVR
ncbi:universal stress protein [Microbacterium sp. No. 7]|uniref:universal stress protein n=1 Tax=Microbacterium sp. No. 7 TaxID=1714373 RepID=UPI0006D13E07|nr:universal stress protein [Microbacterium sp. No. 7]ALJ20361.1 hypothetical protein AOA12_10730 [Microbacterium sp. No. 7]